MALGDTEVGLSFRVLDDPTDADKTKLVAFGQQHEIQIYLQPKGPETTYPLWPEDALLHYRLPEFDLEYQFLPYHFTQVNLALNQRMVSLALDLLAPKAEDRILDLFCGLGNFTLALARRSGQVTGVEGSESLVQWARTNAMHNHLNNVEFYTANLDEELSGAEWLSQTYD